MVLSKRSAAAHLAAGRHINDRTGGELDVRIARKHDDLKPGGTGEHVALLEARLGKDVGALRAGIGLRCGDGRAEYGFRLRVGRLPGFIKGSVDR